MESEFRGRIAVISGGSRGIGLASARALAKAGARTAIIASSPENLQAAARTIVADGGAEPLTIAGDLRSESGCRNAFDKVSAHFGGCDILVNSAGATRAGNFLDQPEDAWQDGFSLKLFSCVRLSRLFWPLLKTSRGRIVNIIGCAARMPDPNFLVGGAVNAAMANFSKGLAALGRVDGVNVNAIHPAMTATERVNELMRQRAVSTGSTPEQILDAEMRKSGMAELVQPESVAELVLFLCSDRARQVQGVAIAVDTGVTPALY